MSRTQGSGLRDLAHHYLESLATGTCVTGKRRFAEATDAHRALELAALRSSVQLRRREHSYYRCPTCGGWHLTSAARRAAPR